MFRLDEALKVYLHREPIDFRLNINGLALLVEQALGLDSVRAVRACAHPALHLASEPSSSRQASWLA